MKNLYIDNITKGFGNLSRRFDNAVRRINPFLNNLQNPRMASGPDMFFSGEPKRENYFLSASQGRQSGSQWARLLLNDTRFYPKEYGHVNMVGTNASLEIIETPPLVHNQFFERHGRDLKGRVTINMAEFVANRLLMLKDHSEIKEAVNDFEREFSCFLDFQWHLQIARMVDALQSKPAIVGFSTMDIAHVKNLGRISVVVDVTPPLHFPYVMIDKTVMDLPLGQELLEQMLLHSIAFGLTKKATHMFAITRDIRLIHALTRVSDSFDKAIGGHSRDTDNVVRLPVEASLGVKIDRNWFSGDYYGRSPIHQFIPNSGYEVTPISYGFSSLGKNGSIYKRLSENKKDAYVFYGKINVDKMVQLIDSTHSLYREIKRHTGNL